MVENITPRDAATLISTTDIDVIDVREEREWLTGHVAGARLVPLDRFRADPDQVLARDRAVIFICAWGVRSLTAAKLAERLGYTRLYNLDGGTQGWTRDGLSLELDAAIATRAA